MVGTRRTHTCGELKASDAGKEVVLCGWVGTVRDHGGLLFADLRDRYGVTQIVFSPTNAALHARAAALRNEFVISVRGQVVAGSVAAAATSLFAVVFLARYFRTRTLTPFAIYCVAAGLISIIRFGIF